MGFDLFFYGMDGGESAAEIDRDGLSAFLRSAGYRVNDVGELVDGNGLPIQFDGRRSALSLDPLDSPEPIEGVLHQATLTAAECGFVFGMCVASRLVIVNPQGPPMVLVPQRSHSREEARIQGWPSDPEDVVWVDNAAELRQALEGDFERFLDYRRLVLEQASRATS